MHIHHPFPPQGSYSIVESPQVHPQGDPARSLRLDSISPHPRGDPGVTPRLNGPQRKEKGISCGIFACLSPEIIGYIYRCLGSAPLSQSLGRVAFTCCEACRSKGSG